MEGLGILKKSTSSGTRTSDIPACNIVPQPTALPRDTLQHKRSIEARITIEEPCSVSPAGQTAALMGVHYHQYRPSQQNGYVSLAVLAANLLCLCTCIVAGLTE
jgi:hypothetical protein